MTNIKKYKSFLPNTITSLNMFFGFLSLIYSSQKEVEWAIVCIIIAAICDTLDGMTARMIKSSSAFGVQLDSLSDLVSFGVAPAYLIYNIELYKYGTLGIIVCAFFMVMGGMRLARFNVQLVGFDKDHFIGLPIPSAAIALCSFIFNFSGTTGIIFEVSNYVIPYVILIGLLMVSKVEYPTLPKFNKKSIKEQPIFFSLVLFSIAAIIFTKGLAIFYIFILFILYGLVTYLFKNKNNGK